MLRPTRRPTLTLKPIPLDAVQDPLHSSKVDKVPKVYKVPRVRKVPLVHQEAPEFKETTAHPDPRVNVVTLVWLEQRESEENPVLGVPKDHPELTELQVLTDVMVFPVLMVATVPTVLMELLEPLEPLV